MLDKIKLKMFARAVHISAFLILTFLASTDICIAGEYQVIISKDEVLSEAEGGAGPVSGEKILITDTIRRINLK